MVCQEPMKKVNFVFGTRPEAIKLAPLVLESNRRGFDTVITLTGQHRELVAPLIELFGIEVNHDLNLMTKGQTPSQVFTRTLEGLDQINGIKDCDCFFVQGDTTSALAGGFWAFSNRIPIAHVEAGLRTYDLSAPYPEEANRQLLSRITDYHFAPTETARKHLLSEGLDESKIFVVGNTGIDSVLGINRRLIANDVPEKFRLPKEVNSKLSDAPMILITAHRRENFGTGFENICDAIETLSRTLPDYQFIYPVHPNPNVRDIVYSRLSNIPGVELIEPQSYVPFIELMSRAKVILTDSGGVQEEAPSLRKRIIVLRESTERPEGVTAGFSTLVGTDTNRIVDETLKALTTPFPQLLENPYGDGHASKKIIDIFSC